MGNVRAWQGYSDISPAKIFKAPVTFVLHSRWGCCALIAGASTLFHESVESLFKLGKTLIIHSILRQRVQQLNYMLWDELLPSVCFEQVKLFESSVWLTWVGCYSWNKMILEQKCFTCMKSMIAWEGVHLCSSLLFSDVTGQCSALLPVVKLNLMYFFRELFKMLKGDRHIVPVYHTKMKGWFE